MGGAGCNTVVTRAELHRLTERLLRCRLALALLASPASLHCACVIQPGPRLGLATPEAAACVPPLAPDLTPLTTAREAES